MTETNRQKNIAEKRQIRHLMQGENAAQSIGKIYKGMEIFGLTKGQYSIINIIEELLKQTGRADVIISTWTAADAEIKKAESFITNGLIGNIKFLVDQSFPSRQKEYSKLLIRKFGKDVIRMTRSHCKFCMIGNKNWKIVIRTSMNLNENKRIENFEISDDPGMYKYLQKIINEIWGKTFEYSEEDFAEIGEKIKSDKQKIVKDAPGEWVSKAEFARIMDISRPRVTELVKKGRIEPNIHGEIHYPSAKKILEEGREQHRANIGEFETLSEARMELETWKAKNEKLKHDKEIGLLISSDEIEDLYTSLVTNSKKKMLSIPSSVSRRLLKKTSIREIEKILNNVIYEALEDLSESNNPAVQ